MKNAFLTGALNDYFTIEAHVASTATTEVYKALDKSRRASVGLWILRQPLAKGSITTRAFWQRMEQLSSFKAGICDLMSYGIDAKGSAFAVFPSIAADHVAHGTFEASEAERRFINTIRIVAELHENDLLCGDLCHWSFFLDREGNVKLTGVLGGLPVESAGTSILPALDTMRFLAPEQRNGEEMTSASDIYALGVLGYYLFTRQYPGGDNLSSATPTALPSTLNPKVPAWTDSVLKRCLDVAPALRFPNAGQLVNAVLNFRIEEEQRAQLPAPQNYTPLTQRHEVSGPVQIKLNTVPSGQRVGGGRSLEAKVQENPSEMARERFRRMVFRVTAGLVLVAGTLAILILNSRKSDTNDPSIGLEQVADASVKPASSEVEEVAAYLRQLVASEDPLAHDVLLRRLKDSHEPEARLLVEQALCDRLRRVGYPRVSERLKEWFRENSGKPFPSHLEKLVRSVDPAVPQATRFALFRELYTTQPVFIMGIVTALMFDSGKPEDFEPLVKPLMSESLGVPEAGSKHPFSLVLASPGLSVLFGEDFIKRQETVPDEDLPWLLELLVIRKDPYARRIAEIILNRGKVEPARTVPLKLIKERSELPPKVLHASMRLANGTATEKDLSAFGLWYDQESERVLAASMVLAQSKTMRVEAFDILAAKSILDPALAELVEWIRKNVWSERDAYAHPVGVLALSQLFPEPEVLKAVQSFETKAANLELIKVLFRSTNAAVLKAVMQTYGSMLPVRQLLGLLTHKEAFVRVEAIKSLGKVNDLGALKFLLDSYESEVDPAVRAAYEQYIEVVKERKARR